MNATGRQFEGLLARYFEGLLADVPTFATAYAGLAEGEGKLGHLSLKFQQQRERERLRALRALENISPRELDNEQQLDRLALSNHLLKECEDYARGRYALEPNAPEQLLNILLHELMRGDDEPLRAGRNLRALLKAAPEFLAEAELALGQPEWVWLRVMEQTVAGATALLRGIEKFLAGAGGEAGNGPAAPGKKKRSRVRRESRPGKSADAAAIEATERALHKYQERARQRPLAPSGSFAIGGAALQRRVRDELGLDYTLGQIEAIALGETERVGHLLKRACGRLGQRGSPEQVIEEARAQWRPEKPLLELYQFETRRIAEGFRRAKAVTFPEGDQLRIKPVPEFLRALIPTAAYTQPGAFLRRQRGVFWVNDLSLTKINEQEKLAEQQQHFGIPLTCAHEAYPGHHLQFVTANRHPRKWRRLFAHAVFYEGWTLWCEQMLVDLKLDHSPWVQVQQLHDALWRCHRILVDLRLQTGRYSYEQGVRHLQRHLGFTRARAEADVNWYTGQPAVPMSYWLGRLENARLHRRLVVGRGWKLQRFNDWLLGFGTIPQGWIEKYGLE